jgi:hypothetical protein
MCIEIHIYFYIYAYTYMYIGGTVPAVFLEAIISKLSSSIPSSTMEELLPTCTLPITKIESIEASNFQSNPSLPPERLAQLTASSQSLLELISTSHSLPSSFVSDPSATVSSSITSLLPHTTAKSLLPHTTIMSTLLSPAIKVTPTKESSSPTNVPTGPLSAAESSPTAMTSNSTSYAGLIGSFGVTTITQSPAKEQKHNIQSVDIPSKISSSIGKEAINKGLQGSFGVTTSTQSPAKEITDAIRKNVKLKSAESLNKIQNIFNKIQNEIQNCKKNDSFNSANDDSLIMNDELPSDGLTIDDGVDNLEIAKSGIYICIYI